MSTYPFDTEIIDQLKCANKNLHSIIKMLEEGDSGFDLFNQLQVIESTISNLKNSPGMKLDSLLLEPDDGHQWGRLFTLLVEELKQEPSQKIMQQRTKGRCLLYINEVKQNIVDECLLKATSAKQQNSARNQLDRLTLIEREVMRRWEAAEAAKWLALAGHPKD